MSNPLTPFRDNPDFRAAYLRLVAKVFRTGLYYRVCAANYQTRANHVFDAAAKREATAVANSLSRAADDMDFIYSKATAILPPEDVEKIVADNPTPFSGRNEQLRSA